MSNRIVIAGYMGFGNAGDEAIAKVMTEHLREAIRDAEITIISGNPEHTAQTCGVRAIGWRDPTAITEAIRHTDLTILGGGGLFQDYWGFDPTAILTREHWGLSFYVVPALLSAVYEKPLMLYAVGVGPLLSEHGRKYTKVAGDIATRITVRDPVSRDLLLSLGVSGDKMEVTADPGFDLTPDDSASEIPEVSEWAARRPAVAVCLRNWGFGTDQTFCERQMAAALDDLVENEGAAILFVPFHVDPGSNDDVALARRATALMRRRGDASLLTQSLCPAALAGIIGRADLVLGMRLHSVIFSVSAGIPFVALEYDPKVEALAGLAGFQEFSMPLGGIEADALAGRLRQALHSKERFQEMAASTASTLRCRARQNAAIAAELLRQGAGVSDYGADARALMARMVTAQVATSEGLVERMRACLEALGLPAAELKPFEMGDAAVRKAKEFRPIEADRDRLQVDRDRLWGQLDGAWKALTDSNQQLEEVRERLQGSWRELEAAGVMRQQLVNDNQRLCRELEAAGEEQKSIRSELAAVQERLETESQDLDRTNSQLLFLRNEHRAAEDKIARLESKTLGGILKRSLQLALDTLQIVTPGPLRNAVRKYYLNWFYFRIYPERRANSPGHSGRDS